MGPAGMEKMFGAATMEAAAGIELMLGDCLMGHRFTTMWEEKAVTCDINDAAGKNLDEIVDAFWAAFSPVIVPTPAPAPKAAPSEPPVPRVSDKNNRQ